MAVVAVVVVAAVAVVVSKSKQYSNIYNSTKNTKQIQNHTELQCRSNKKITPQKIIPPFSEGPGSM